MSFFRLSTSIHVAKVKMREEEFVVQVRSESDAEDSPSDQVVEEVIETPHV